MLNSIFLILITLFLASCGNYVSVKVMRPSEISTTQFKKVYVDEVLISGNGRNSSQEFLRRVETALSKAEKYYKDKSFGKDHSNENYESIFYDYETFQFKLNQELYYKKYFQLLEFIDKVNADKNVLIIQADIINFEYNEEIDNSESFKDNYGNKHYYHVRKAKQTLKVNYQLKSINGENIGMKSIENYSSRTTSEIDKDPSEIDRYTLELELIKKSINEFLRYIIPYEEQVKVELKDDESMPDLKKGIEAAENGFWDIAITHFTRSTKANSNPLVHYAYYNLGVAYLYSYDFVNARIHLRKALEMKGNESSYKRMYQELDRMERDEIRLKEQRK